MSFKTSVSRFVALLTRTTALTSGGAAPAGTPIRSLVYPDTGGVQAVDALGVVETLAGSSGSGDVIDIIDTNRNEPGNSFVPEVALTLRHVVSSPSTNVPASGVGVQQNFSATTRSNGTVTVGAQATMLFTDVTVGLEKSRLILNTLNAGSLDPHLIIEDTGDVTPGDSSLSQKLGTATRPWASVRGAQGIFTRSASTSGTTQLLSVTGAANTNVTASTEETDVLFDFARTVTWAAGPIANQRFFSVTAPTIAFGGASTVTNAATVAISGAPAAGANATITNAYAVWSQAGRNRFDGTVVQNVYPVLQSTGTDGVPVTTINTPAGITVVANGATTVTVTCAACTTATLIWAQIRNTTTNNVTIRSVEPGAGSFVVRLSGDPGASTAIIGVQIVQPGSGS